MPVPTGQDMLDELEFASKQLEEHCLFMALGIDPPLPKAQAAKLQEKWERFRKTSRSPRDFVALAKETRIFKVQIFDRLNHGEWLGWLFPSFVDHVRRELDMFVARIEGTPLSIEKEIGTWDIFMAEHAAYAAHYLDPTEAQAFATALQHQEKFENLAGQCANTVTQQLLALTSRSTEELDTYLQILGGGLGNPPSAPAKSVIHPVLRDHVIREGRKFVQILELHRQRPLT